MRSVALQFGYLRCDGFGRKGGDDVAGSGGRKSKGLKAAKYAAHRVTYADRLGQLGTDAITSGAGHVSVKRSVTHIQSPSLIGQPYQRETGMTSTTAGKNLHISHDEVEAALGPSVRSKPVKEVAAIADMSAETVKKWRLGRLPAAFRTVANILANDDAAWERFTRAIRRDLATIDQQIAAREVEITRLRALKRGLLNETPGHLVRSVNVSCPGDSSEPGGASSDLGG